jgi:ribosomal protein S18 acetylase RimI-like enzyme
MEIRRIAPDDGQALGAFFQRVPDGDRTFFKEDVVAPGLVEAWVLEGTAHRFVSVTDRGEIAGYVAVFPSTGWSAHVGEVRLVVDPAHRGRGVGRALAQHALLDALGHGLTKIFVEVVADQTPAIAMFLAIGFRPEGLLHDHIRDRSGQLRDLIVLSHSATETWSAMATAGIDEALR